MTESTPQPRPAQPAQSKPQQPPQDTESSVRQAGQPRHSESRSESGSGTFADGSTQEQQDQLVKEAEEANQQTKDYADAEREAREDG